MAASLLMAAQAAPIRRGSDKAKGKKDRAEKDNNNNSNGNGNAPGLNKLTSSNAGGLLRGEARAEWARLNASAKKRAEERLDKVRAAVGM